VRPACSAGSFSALEFEAGGHALEMFGSFSNNATTTSIFPADDRAFGVTFNGAGPSRTVTVDLDIRDPKVSKAFTHYDLRLSALDCLLVGTVIPSTIG
jgi:hypothetical protein